MKKKCTNRKEMKKKRKNLPFDQCISGERNPLLPRVIFFVTWLDGKHMNSLYSETKQTRIAKEEASRQLHFSDGDMKTTNETKSNTNFSHL